MEDRTNSNTRNAARQTALDNDFSSSSLSSAPSSPEPQRQRKARDGGPFRTESQRVNARFMSYAVPSRVEPFKAVAPRAPVPRAQTVAVVVPSEPTSNPTPTARTASAKQPESVERHSSPIEDRLTGANNIQIYHDTKITDYDHIESLLDPIRIIINTLFEYVEDKPVTGMTMESISRPWNRSTDAVTLYTLEHKSRKKIATGMDVFTTKALKDAPIWLRRGILKKHCSDLVVMLCIQAVKNVLSGEDVALVEWTINYPKPSIYFVDKGKGIDDDAQQSAILVTSKAGEEYVADLTIEQIKWGAYDWFSTGSRYMQNCVRKKEDEGEGEEEDDNDAGNHSGDAMQLDDKEAEEMGWGMIHEDDAANLKEEAEEDDWFVDSRNVIEKIWTSDNIHEYRALAPEDREDFWPDLVHEAWKEIAESARLVLSMLTIG